MGMSMHVQGMEDMDEKGKAMKFIWDKCNELDIEPPDEVQEYFDYEYPEEGKTSVEIPHKAISTKSRQGYEIELSNLPKEVTHIQFYCMW